MTQPSYFIFQGGPELARSFYSPTWPDGGEWYWTCLKDVKPNDHAFIYLTAPESRIVGEVRIVGEPFFNGEPHAFDNPKMWNRWCVEVGHPIGYSYSRDLAIWNMRRLFGAEFPWLKRPQGNVRVPDAVLRPMMEIVRKLRRNAQPCPAGCEDGYLTGGTFNDQRRVCTTCNGN